MDYAQYHIPRQAVVPHLGGEQVVWELVGGKQMVPVVVNVGITDYTNTQLLSGNLKQGDVLVMGEITNGSETFRQGGPRFGGRR